MPWDNRLQLPARPFSYVLQDWDQSWAVQQAFRPVDQTIARMLKLHQAVDSLEGMNRQMAEDVSWFRELYITPPPAAEGALTVVTADCKGIVIRGQGRPTVCGGQRPHGQRANQKRRATVGAVDTVDAYVRSADAVVAAVVRDPDYQPASRPQPGHKHVWASMPVTEPAPRSSSDAVFTGLQWAFAQRHPDVLRPTVRWCDGQDALGQACAAYLPDENAVDILDLLHVTPRLWDAAKLRLGPTSAAVIPWVRPRLTQILEGKVETVIRGIRRQAKDRGLRGSKKPAIDRLCRYLSKNRSRMRYDVDLRLGYPIASGVIEGAGRHLVNDRMERAGMHWTLKGAQAMLDLRSGHIGGHWQAYQTYRIESETERLYPHRESVAGEAFFAWAA